MLCARVNIVAVVSKLFNSLYPRSESYSDRRRICHSYREIVQILSAISSWLRAAKVHVLGGALQSSSLFNTSWYTAFTTQMLRVWLSSYGSEKPAESSRPTDDSKRVNYAWASWSEPKSRSCFESILLARGNGSCHSVLLFVWYLPENHSKWSSTKAPLQKMSIVSVPFHRVGIDLIGPTVFALSSGNKYILTIVDYATRYPEAVALPGISTEQVAEAQSKVYSRVGVPKQIVTDHGIQFTSDVIKEVSRLLSIEHVTSSLYHPQCKAEKLTVPWNLYWRSSVRKNRRIGTVSLNQPCSRIVWFVVKYWVSLLSRCYTIELSGVQTTYQYYVCFWFTEQTGGDL